MSQHKCWCRFLDIQTLWPMRPGLHTMRRCLSMTPSISPSRWCFAVCTCATYSCKTPDPSWNVICNMCRWGALARAQTRSIVVLQASYFRNCTRLQVNGKLRGTVEVAKGITQEEAVALAQEQESVGRFLNGKELKKIIFVQGRILNFIISKWTALKPFIPVFSELEAVPYARQCDQLAACASHDQLKQSNFALGTYLNIWNTTCWSIAT